MVNKDLLFSVSVDNKEIKISLFSGKGPGGQNRNKCKKCVRLFHKASGANVVGQNHRSLEQNRKDAINNMAKHPKFKAWMKLEIAKHSKWWHDMQKEVHRVVDSMMDRENLRIEVYNKEKKRWEVQCN